MIEQKLAKTGNTNAKSWYFYLPLYLLGVVFFQVMIAGMFNDADTAWHLQAGIDILNDGITLKDSWAFTTTNYTWYNISWLGDVVFALFYNVFGATGLYIIAFVAMLLTLIYVIKNITYNKPLFIGLVFAFFMAGLSILPVINARPHLFSLAFTAYLYLQSKKLMQEDINFRHALVLFACLTLVWANIHGGFILIYPILGAYFLQALANRNFYKAKEFFIIGAVCCIATFINPLGYNLYVGVWRTLGGPMQQYISEWQALAFTSISGIHYIYVLMLIFFIRFYSWSKERLAEYILTILWIVATFLSQRNIGTLVIFSAPLLASLISHNIAAKPALLNSNKFYKAKYSKYCKLACVIMLALVVAITFSRGNIGSLLATQIANKVAPMQSIEYLKQNHKGQNIFNHYNIGGFLTHFNANKFGERQFKHFVDGRAETAFSIEVLKDTIKINNLNEGWQEAFARHNFAAAIIPNKNKYLAYNISKLQGWQVVFEGERAVVLAKD